MYYDVMSRAEGSRVCRVVGPRATLCFSASSLKRLLPGRKQRLFDLVAKFFFFPIAHEMFFILSSGESLFRSERSRMGEEEGEQGKEGEERLNQSVAWER